MNHHNNRKDPLGHVLLEARVRSIPELADSYMKEYSCSLSQDVIGARDFLVTGVGSSWGHAQYASSLLRDYGGKESRAVPLSGFLRTKIKRDYSESVLLLFSQGFSDNARIALQHRDKFKKIVIFTSATAHSLRELKLEERARQYEELEAEGVEFVHFPLTSEYTLLIRVVGPLLGYLACCKFLAAFPENTLPALDQEALARQLQKEGEDDLHELFDDVRARSPLIVATYPLSIFATNLSYKFLEGIFSPALGVCDLLEFSHGPFQQLVANPRPVIVLETLEMESELKERLSTMLTHSGAPFLFLPARLPAPFSIIEYEQQFNWLICDLAARFHAKQVDWPGQGHDAALYNLSA